MEPLKPLQQLNWFFKLAPEKTLCGIDQLVYLHLFNKFNQSHWAETILLEDATLLELIRWYDKTGNPTSLDSIRKAKARLKKKGLIDFTAGHGNKATEYRLIRLYPPDTPTNTRSDSPPDTGSISYTRVREDVKRRKDRDDDDASARKVETAREQQATVTRPKPLSSPKSDANEIQSVWQQSFGFALFGDNALTLEQLAAEDFARAELAIKKTVARNLTTTNPSAVLAYFRKVYESTPPTPQQTPKTKKTSFEDQFDWDAIKAQLELTGGK